MEKKMGNMDEKQVWVTPSVTLLESDNTEAKDYYSPGEKLTDVGPS